MRAKAVLVTQVTEFPRLTSQADSDRNFNYLEAACPQYLSPSRGETGTALGYVYRYYAGSNAFIGTKEGKLYFLVPSIDNNINLLQRPSPASGRARKSAAAFIEAQKSFRKTQGIT